MRRIPEPVIRRLAGPAERWILDEPYSIVLPIIHRELFIVGGFSYDGASVPRLARVVLHPQEAPAFALVHDALYSSELLPRHLCDEIGVEIAKLDGCSAFQRVLIYNAVRIGGYFVWSNHRPFAVRRARKLVSLDSPP